MLEPVICCCWPSVVCSGPNVGEAERVIAILCEDGGIQERIAGVARQCGYEAVPVRGTMEALSCPGDGACVLALYFERLEPLHVRFVRKVSERWPGLGTVCIGEENTAAVAVDIMRAGADFYIVRAELEDRLFDALEALGESLRARLASRSPGGGDRESNLDGLRDTLGSLLSLSRSAMSALESVPGGVRAGQPSAAWFKAGMTMRDLERQAIEAALRRCGDNRTRTAGVLQISIRTLHRKIREYDL